MKRAQRSEHATLTELASRQRRAGRMKKASELEESLDVLDEVHEACPSFVPALLLAGRRLQSSKAASPADLRAGMRKARKYLQKAVVASDRSAASLVELGYFLHVVEKQPQAAESMLRAGVEKALTVLEDGWAGLLDVLCSEGRLEEARALGKRAQTLFPDSVRIATALTPAMAELPAGRKTPARPARRKKPAS
jgi:tetratricopeptide (TPR) repeat protein